MSELNSNRATGQVPILNYWSSVWLDLHRLESPIVALE